MKYNMISHAKIQLSKEALHPKLGRLSENKIFNIS
jgi:hypothetical protein